MQFNGRVELGINLNDEGYTLHVGPLPVESIRALNRLC